MKTLLVLFVSAFLTSAHAEGPQVSALKASDITITVQSPRCPQGAICEAASMLTATYTAKGCLDSIVVTGKVDELLSAEENKRVILSAINIHNPKSKTTMCIRMPTKKVDVMLGLGFASKENIEVVELTKVLK